LRDPLDGTASFVDGFPGFVIQAALMENNQPVLSCVHAPSLEETFLAEKGSGATKNGDLIVTNNNMNNNIVQTDNYPEPKGIAAEIACDLEIPGYLESGSIGLKICRVAEGKAHLFVKDIELYDWDVAAPHLILKESGGILTDGLGNNFSYYGSFMKNGLIVASNKDLFLRVLKWIKAR
jgi:fructose-1,6-bisphosphatase/inositol monophosphatase family enzyme